MIIDSFEHQWTHIFIIINKLFPHLMAVILDIDVQ